MYKYISRYKLLLCNLLHLPRDIWSFCGLAITMLFQETPMNPASSLQIQRDSHKLTYMQLYWKYHFPTVRWHSLCEIRNLAPLLPNLEYTVEAKICKQEEFSAYENVWSCGRDSSLYQKQRDLSGMILVTEKNHEPSEAHWLVHRRHPEVLLKRVINKQLLHILVEKRV